MRPHWPSERQTVNVNGSNSLLWPSSPLNDMYKQNDKILDSARKITQLLFMKGIIEFGI